MYKIPEFRLEYITTFEHMELALAEMYSSSTASWGCDTETTGLDPHTDKIRIIQFATQEVAYIFDFFKLPESIEKIKEYLEDIEGKVTLIWQNASFDIKMLWSVGIDLYGHRLYDTMLAGAVVEAGLQDTFSLAALCQRYLDLDLSKEEQRSDWSLKTLTPSQLKYAATDSVAVHALAPKIHKEVKRLNQQKVVELEHLTLPAVAAMEWYGTYISLDRVKEIKPYYEQLENEAKVKVFSKLKNLFSRRNLLGEVQDEGISLTSPIQTLKAFRNLGIPNPDKKSEDKLIPSTSKGIIKLLDLQKYTVLADFLEYRKNNTLLTKFVYRLPDYVNKATGKIHTTFRQNVSTGRLSSAKPNLNQLPRADGTEYTLRTCFVAKEGYKLCQADYSQIEPRIIAEILCDYHGDDTALNEFVEGKDPYCALGAALLKMPYEEFMKLKESKPKYWKSIRTLSKALKLGLNYAMGFHRLRNYAKTDFGIALSLKESAKNRDAYLGIYPGLIKYHEYYSDKTRKEAFSLPPYGRIRRWDVFPGVSGICNHPIQGCLQFDTYVLTKQGYRKIGELYEESKQVTVWTGTSWETADVLNRGKARLATLELGTGKRVPIDVRHKVLVATEDGTKFKEAAKITEKDLVCTSLAEDKYAQMDFDITPDYYFAETINSREMSLRIDLNEPELWYWFGYILGASDLEVSQKDGFNSYLNSLGLSIEHSEVVFKCIIDLLGKNYTIHTRRIPSKLFQKPRECQLDFLRGLIDAASFISEESEYISIQSSSRLLLEDTYLLAHSFGINSRLSNQANGSVLNLNPEQSSVLLGLDILPVSRTPAHRPKPSQLYEYVSGCKYIEGCEVQDTYTLSVHSPLHRYDSETLISKNTAADIQKLAIAKTYERLHRLGYSPTQSHDVQLILTIHDETVLMAKSYLADMAHKLQVDCMIEAAKTVLKKCPIEVDGGVIDNLSQKA